MWPLTWWDRGAIAFLLLLQIWLFGHLSIGVLLVRMVGCVVLYFAIQIAIAITEAFLRKL